MFLSKQFLLLLCQLYLQIDINKTLDCILVNFAIFIHILQSNDVDIPKQSKLTKLIETKKILQIYKIIANTYPPHIMCWAQIYVLYTC